MPDCLSRWPPCSQLLLLRIRRTGRGNGTTCSACGAHTRLNRAWGHAAWVGGPWEYRILPSGPVAVRVPSGWQVMVQPHR
jgi:hypothetical protein